MARKKTAQPVELSPAELEERSAYYALVAERRGDNTRGRVLPSRVETAEQRWHAALDALKEES